jgi:hypothetical protein
MNVDLASKLELLDLNATQLGLVDILSRLAHQGIRAQFDNREILNDELLRQQPSKTSAQVIYPAWLLRRWFSASARRRLVRENTCWSKNQANQFPATAVAHCKVF